MSIELGSPLGAARKRKSTSIGPGWVVKLTRWRRDHAPARREDAILRALAPTGLAPAPGGVVEIEGRWGVVMEHVAAPGARRTAERTGWSGRGAGGDAAAAPAGARMWLRRRVCHSSRIDSTRNISGTRLLDETTRRRLLDALAALPDGDRLCHGDFHPYNIMGSGDDARIVDWLDASAADPAADVCRTFVLIGSVEPALARALCRCLLRRGRPRQNSGLRLAARGGRVPAGREGARGDRPAAGTGAGRGGGLTTASYSPGRCRWSKRAKPCASCRAR